MAFSITADIKGVYSNGDNFITEAGNLKMVQELAEEETGDTKKSSAAVIDKLDEEMLKEEAAQMEKAIKVLLNEYENRKRIREKTKRAAGQVTKRVAAKNE